MAFDFQNGDLVKSVLSWFNVLVSKFTNWLISIGITVSEAQMRSITTLLALIAIYIVLSLGTKIKRWIGFGILGLSAWILISMIFFP